MKSTATERSAAVSSEPAAAVAKLLPLDLRSQPRSGSGKARAPGSTERQFPPRAPLTRADFPLHLRSSPNLWGFLLCLSFLPVCAFAAGAAADNADNPPYAATNLQPGDNGGFGFTPWRLLEYGSPGSRFVTQAIDSGRRSWALAGTYALGRGLATPLSGGSWHVLAVHGDSDEGFSGFTLKSSTQSGLAAGELLRFGINPRVGLYQGSGVHVSTNGGVSWSYLDCGWSDGPGDTIEYVVTWDASGAWWLSVNNWDEGISTAFAGVMPAGSVAMLGLTTSCATLAEGLTFDDFTVTAQPDTPTLSIRQDSASTVTLAWPAPAYGWQLQQTTSLSATNWVNVSQPPQPVASGWQVVVPVSPPNTSFFRLRK
jgi:hypothetical protein